MARSFKKDAKVSSDARVKRSTGDEDIAPSEDRVAVESRQVQDEERFDEFSVDDWNFDRLPMLPDIPGYRNTWLSTTHSTDTVARRMRLGYEPIRPEEVPLLKHLQLKGGVENEGMIACNEMLAFKIPEKLYQRYMTHFHHVRPQEEEETIREEIDRQQNIAEASKGRIDLEGGMEDLGKASRPIFN